MKRNTKQMKLAVAATFFLLLLTGAVAAQTSPRQDTTAPDQLQRPNAGANQAQVSNPGGNQFADLGLLNLTQDQIRRIRIINAELKDERQEAVLRQRLAQRALTEAIEATTPNEALIDQRSREMAEAQANTIRLRSLTEARILQVLTPEQRTRLKEIRQRNLAQRPGRQQGPNAGQQGLQRNPNNSLLSPEQRRALRRQQKP